MKKILFVIASFWFLAGYSQTVAPVNISQPYNFLKYVIAHDSIRTATLTVTATFIPPSYSTASRPAAGGIIQLIYNTDSAKMQYSTGSSWVTIGSTPGSGGSYTPGYGINIVGSTIKWDSANARKVDTVYRVSDSTFAFKVNGGGANLVLLRGNGVKYSDTAAMLAPYLRSSLQSTVAGTTGNLTYKSSAQGAYTIPVLYDSTGLLGGGGFYSPELYSSIPYNVYASGSSIGSTTGLNMNLVNATSTYPSTSLNLATQSGANAAVIFDGSFGTYSWKFAAGIATNSNSTKFRIASSRRASANLYTNPFTLLADLMVIDSIGNVSLPQVVTAVTDTTNYKPAAFNISTHTFVQMANWPTASGGGSCTGCMLGANNLSDVTNVSASRTNLGLGTAAVQNVAYFLQAANNGSDIANTATFRTNLGLGTAAVQNVSYFLQAANNGSDIANTTTFRTNLGLGSLATLSSVNNANWSGTALSISNGGWGRTSALAAGLVQSNGTTYGTVTIGLGLLYNTGTNTIYADTSVLAVHIANSYFQNGLNSINDSTSEFGGNLLHDTHLSGSNLYNMYFDSTKVLFTGPNYNAANSLDTTNWKLFVIKPSTGETKTMYWQVPGTGGGSSNYTVATAANTGNYTMTTATYVILTDLTGQANRTLTLPGSPASGQPFIIENNNGGASGFTWSFSGTVKDAGNNTITTVPNTTVVQLVYNGTYFKIVN